LNKVHVGTHNLNTAYW